MGYQKTISKTEGRFFVLMRILADAHKTVLNLRKA